jgi:glycerol-3-phosphate acyltransferase PlsX
MVELMVDGRADAVLSAGNTGAVVAAAQVKARMLKGVRRPGIMVVIPTMHGPVVVIDVGANIYCKPVQLAQYGVMASVYSRRVLGVKEPRVGLLSIGEEEGKGTELVRETRALMKESPINFRGNAEGRDVFTGRFDVITCDGFVGNVLLKVIEAMAEGVFQTLSSEVAAAEPSLAGRLEPILKRVWERHDYSTYGGAPLLGIDGICIISHGSSKARAIMNALKAASEFGQHKVNEAIEAALAPAGELSQ